MAPVDCVDGVVDRAVHHRQMDRGYRRALAGGGDERIRGVNIPVRHRVGARGRGESEQGSGDREQHGAART
jgi:hypothetical protein